MASIGTLTTYPNNYRAFKALIAAKYTGANIDLAPFQMGVTNKDATFLSKFPLGKVPVFETADGQAIFESDAIATYVASLKPEAGLLGTTPVEQAHVQTFIHFATNEIVPASSTWLYPINGWLKYNKDAHERAVADLKRSLEALNNWLATRTYLAAEHITLADIVVTLSLLGLYTRVFDPAFRAPFGNVNRYFLTIVNQPNFVAVVGEVKLAEKAEVYNPAAAAPAAAAAPKKEEKKEEKKPKEEKPKEEKKKEEKKPAPKKEEEEEEPEESYEDEAPKGKNPLDLLPPSKFNLEAWKRFYSNNSEADSIKWFWENYDAEGFSIWRGDYKYNDENSKVYMTCNLVNGFFQRIEKARKYAFGSVLIFGEDDKNEIRAIWVFRGQEVPFEVRDAPDSESYEWVKLNSEDQKTREQINAFFAWAEIDPVAKFHDASTLTFNQGKTFK